VIENAISKITTPKYGFGILYMRFLALSHILYHKEYFLRSTFLVEALSAVICYNHLKFNENAVQIFFRHKTYIELL